MSAAALCHDLYIIYLHIYGSLLFVLFFYFVYAFNFALCKYASRTLYKHLRLIVGAVGVNEAAFVTICSAEHITMTPPPKRIPVPTRTWRSTDNGAELARRAKKKPNPARPDPAPAQPKTLESL